MNDAIYNSNGGPFTIIKELDSNSLAHDKKVLIQFINTKYTKEVYLSNALNGRIKDDSLHYLDLNKIWMSNNYGPFKITQILDKPPYTRQKVIIEFINTKFQKEVLLSNAYKGNVKDDSILALNSVSHFTSNQLDILIEHKLRETIHCVITRCTNPHHKEYNNYGAIGVKVCDRWMDSSNFIHDAKFLPQYEKFYKNPYMYELDKDYLQFNIAKSNRIYSPETCMWLYVRDNINLKIIENSQNANLSSQYYGVCKIKDKWYMSITCNTYKIDMYFNNEIAAANAYNYWFEKLHLYELVKLYNDAPSMPVEVWTQYIISKRPLFK